MNVPAGSTLIVKGPASVKLISGSGNVFGYPLSVRKQLSVRGWRSIPIYTESGMEVEVTLGEGASADIVGQDTIPSGWKKLAEEKVKGSRRLVIIGRTDSGKTSLSTYILNSLVRMGAKICLVDLDVGQSSICPPTTVGMSVVAKPTPDLYNLSASSIIPVGMTSPSYVMSYHMNKSVELVRSVEPWNVYVLVDCDGWMDGEGALAHKSGLLSLIKPSLVVFLGTPPRELEDFCKREGIEFVKVEKPEQVYKRDMDARKRLRESAYRKYLKDATIKVIPISWTDLRPITADIKGTDEGPIEHMERILQAYNSQLDQPSSISVESMLKQRVGFLSYLFDAKGGCTGIGLLSEVESRKNTIKVFTSVEGVPRKLLIGCILVSYYGDELFVWKSI